MNGGVLVKSVEDAIAAIANVSKKIEKVVVGWLMMKRAVMNEERRWMMLRRAVEVVNNVACLVVLSTSRNMEWSRRMR